MWKHLFLVCCIATLWPETASRSNYRPPALSTRDDVILSADGLSFKDLNHNGRLDPYEDWRLTPHARTGDLLNRLSLEEAAGLLVHGSLQDTRFYNSSTAEKEQYHTATYDLQRVKRWVLSQHVSSFVTRLDGTAADMAAANNAVQEIAESGPFGIPVTISSDPRRHQVLMMLGAPEQDRAFSLWPEPLGLAAVGDPELTRRFGDTVRREYMAVGIRESLAPQADLATEPRWTRIAGTFGEEAALASTMVQAYVTGVQGGMEGLTPGSVISVVKHWAAYGAAVEGWDSHNFYGRFSRVDEGSFAYHLTPYRGAFLAHVGGVMPSYSVIEGATVGGQPLEAVGAGFSHQLLDDLLRKEYRFDGVVLSDWRITYDCKQACRDGAPAGTRLLVTDTGMPWGVEDLPRAERFAKTINAGVDQIGGTEEASLIVADVRNGLINEARVREAAGRVLLQKFDLGLFENPYVDEKQAALVAGNAAFVRDGEAAQARAAVLLENRPATASGKPLLPVMANSRKVYLYGVSASAAQAAGFIVVGDPTKADFAIVRAPAPYASEHPGYFFGAQQHEGRLDFTKADPAYAELLRVSQTTPTVFVTTLERPLILANVKPFATALLGDFGLADVPLFALITGRAAPEGRLPFELPSSVEAVRNQRSDLPHDSVAPLYPFHYGLRYPQRSSLMAP